MDRDNLELILQELRDRRDQDELRSTKHFLSVSAQLTPRALETFFRVDELNTNEQCTSFPNVNFVQVRRKQKNNRDCLQHLHENAL